MRADLHLEDSDCSKMEVRLEGCQDPDRDTLIIFLLRAIGCLCEQRGHREGD